MSESGTVLQCSLTAARHSGADGSSAQRGSKQGDDGAVPNSATQRSLGSGSYADGAPVSVHGASVQGASVSSES